MIVVSLAIVYKVDTFQTTVGRPTACLGDGSRPHSNIVFFFIVDYNDHGLNSFCFLYGCCARMAATIATTMNTTNTVHHGDGSGTGKKLPPTTRKPKGWECCLGLLSCAWRCWWKLNEWHQQNQTRTRQNWTPTNWKVIGWKMCRAMATLYVTTLDTCWYRFLGVLIHAFFFLLSLFFFIFECLNVWMITCLNV